MLNYDPPTRTWSKRQQRQPLYEIFKDDLPEGLMYFSKSFRKIYVPLGLSPALLAVENWGQINTINYHFECHESSVNHAHDQTWTSSSGITWYHRSHQHLPLLFPQSSPCFTLQNHQGTQRSRDQRSLRCRWNYVRLATSVETTPRCVFDSKRPPGNFTEKRLHGSLIYSNPRNSPLFV